MLITLTMITFRLFFKREYCFYGMRRSGHHGVIHWGQAVCGYPFHINDQADYPPVFVGQRSKQDKNLKQIKQAFASDCLAYNYEDAHAYKIKKIQNRRMSSLNKNTKETVVIQSLVLRDPINCFSSRLYHKAVGPKDFRDNCKIVRNTWKQHANIFLKKEPEITMDILINYNEWHRNIDYRKEIANQLGGTFTDQNKQIIAGPGSSFQGRKNYTAEQLTPYDRWKEGLKRPEYLTYFDEEIFELARTIFPKLEGLDEVYKAWHNTH